MILGTHWRCGLYERTMSMSRWHRFWILAVAAVLLASVAAFSAPASASGETEKKHSESVEMHSEPEEGDKDESEEEGESEDSDHETIVTYLVTVSNLTENQTLTPAVVATHYRSFRLFKKNRPASNGIQQLAENGGVPVLVDELTGNDHVADVAVTEGGPILPGQSASTLITTYEDANRISVAAMLICTNDGFASVSSAKLPGHRGETTKYGRAYDAGTEINTQNFVDLVPPCSGTGVGTGMSNPALAENGTVRNHRGRRPVTGDARMEEPGHQGHDRTSCHVRDHHNESHLGSADHSRRVRCPSGSS